MIPAAAFNSKYFQPDYKFLAFPLCAYISLDSCLSSLVALSLPLAFALLALPLSLSPSLSLSARPLFSSTNAKSILFAIDRIAESSVYYSPQFGVESMRESRGSVEPKMQNKNVISIEPKCAGSYGIRYFRRSAHPKCARTYAIRIAMAHHSNGNNSRSCAANILSPMVRNSL